MKILMLSSTFPYPPSRGGTEIRTFNLLKHLNRSHHLTLLTQTHSGVTEDEIATLRQWVDQLVTFPLPEDSPPSSSFISLTSKIGRWLESWYKLTPPNVLHRYSPALQAWIDQAVGQRQFDVITCEHSVNEIYIRPEWRSQIPSVVNVHSSVYGWTRQHLEMGASAHVWRDRLYLPLLRHYEHRYCKKFTELVVTTEDDRNELSQTWENARITIVPNGVDVELFPQRTHDPGGHQLIYVGAMDATHNIDAVRFFVLQVLPILQQDYPDLHFWIVGARPAASVLELQTHHGVKVTGAVDTIVDFFHQATICVLPLRTGLGIKNKTLEAMAAGVPVVGSDRALEGLVVDGAACPLRALRANRASEYVAAIRRLFEHPELRQQLSKSGRSLVETDYTWERVGHQYEQVLWRSQVQ
jgi:glycosyltransferase involved in cell wall biosynthesis